MVWGAHTAKALSPLFTSMYKTSHTSITEVYKHPLTRSIKCQWGMLGKLKHGGKM